MNDSDLIKTDYHPHSEIYEIKTPEIQSGDTYYFTTESGLRYQVRFGKKRNDYLGNIVNFSVLSDEFEDEYSETNRGEVYRIIATVIEIVRIYHKNHIHSNSYEFTGEFKKKHDKGEASIRSRLYFRYAKRLLTDNWNAELMANKVHIYRKK